MGDTSFWLSFALLSVVMLLYLCVAPFTKVEESFNLQACHDILYHGTDLEQYDHLQFPGVVPRTFLGPLALAIVAYPAHAALHAIGLTTKFASQYLVRAILGLVLCAALASLASAAERVFQRGAGLCFACLTALQFHVLFYASRPLPNTFALAFVTCALAQLLRGRALRCVALLIVATAVFRCELGLLTLPLVLQLWLSGHLTVRAFLRCAVPLSLVALAATVAVDSWFWRRLLYPEGEVFYFNVVLGQSSAWGVMPWHWYASSALPRALSASAALLPFGVACEPRRFARLLASSLLFVAAYSWLPHKELRFVLYAVPPLTLASAVALSRALSWARAAWRGRAPPSSMSRCVALGAALLALGCAAASGGTSVVAAWASHHNYAGGVAFRELHELYRHRDALAVHIDVAAAQSGVSRFGERSHWSYSKDERRPLDTTPFDVLLGEAPDVAGFRRVHTVHGFARLAWRRWLTTWPVRPLAELLVLEPRIYILERA